MSLVPEFELGLWNGWIFLIPYILVLGSSPLLKIVSVNMRERSKRERERKNLPYGHLRHMPD